MKQKEKFSHFLRQFKHVSKLLPSLASNRLDSDELSAVQQHLKICSQCSAEWAEYQSLQIAFQSREEQKIWQPPEGHFNQLLAMIEAQEAATETSNTIEAEGAKSPSTMYQEAISSAGIKKRQQSDYHQSISRSVQLLPTVMNLNSWFRWPLAIESAALVVISVLIFTTQSNNQPATMADYETLTSNSVVGIDSQGLKISLVFAESMTEAEISNLLKSTRGQMVSGPSDLGVYTIKVASSKLTNTELESVLTAYRNNPKVRILESNAISTNVNPNERQ